MTPSPPPDARPSSRTHPNRLAAEKSPYLLQHQWNPVDWHPWGEAAFERARREAKPVFLSIGYSTCHWCHVMERESFEDQEVAQWLNAHFVSIKVDREERPDVDKIYMTFVQTTTGQGGWPLNVFLTPELKPFYGGTYFPPSPRYGRPSFTQLLQHIQELWSTRHPEVLRSAADLYQRLSAFTTPSAAETPTPSTAWLQAATAQFTSEFDTENGGFGGAPKFPRPSQPAFLLRQAVRHRDAETLRMVVHTCDRMAAGGLQDHLGGGFHRYAVDTEWRVPHFEKMLYDNAQLADLYLDVFLATGDDRHAQTARAVLDYVSHDMTHPRGGFFSAEDADSEGHEGKFYCWTLSELTSLLQPEELRLVANRFGVTSSGNFVDHSHPQPLTGQNVLRLAEPSLTLRDRPLLESALRKMRRARERRVRPHRDDKILASWNGLMLGAFARASIILGEPVYLQRAEDNLAFLQAELWDADARTLFHRWRDEERDTVQLLDGYAHLLSGTLDLYEATLAERHLQFALDLAQALIEKFSDADRGGFYQSASTEHLILRLKEDYDGAEPSGNSVAALSLLRLAAITDHAACRTEAEKALKCFALRLQEQPAAVPYLLQALDFTLYPPHRVVITGSGEAPKFQQLLRAAHSVYQPNKVVLGQPGPVEAFARSLPADPKVPVAYVCSGTSCQPPTNDPDLIRNYLQMAAPVA